MKLPKLDINERRERSTFEIVTIYYRHHSLFVERRAVGFVQPSAISGRMTTYFGYLKPLKAIRSYDWLPLRLDHDRDIAIDYGKITLDYINANSS